MRVYATRERVWRRKNDDDNDDLLSSRHAWGSYVSERWEGNSLILSRMNSELEFHSLIFMTFSTGNGDFSGG